MQGAPEPVEPDEERKEPLARDTARGELLVDLLWSHLREAPEEEEARIARIAEETSRAFTELHDVRRAVSIFGSHLESSVACWEPTVERLAEGLVREGFTVITGGGPGVMAAANRGAQQAGGTSLGLTIDLEEDEGVNPYLDRKVAFHYFFLRKLAFMKYSLGFVCFPGGYGTLDELFEAANLVRTHKLDPHPILLFGSPYWGGLVDWLRGKAVRSGFLAEPDVDLLEVVDEVEDAVERLCACQRRLEQKLESGG